MTDLQRRDEAERLIAELAGHVRGLGERRDLAGVKSVRDVALAAERYARAKKLGEEAERYAAEIATRAERRIGQLLTATPKAAGGGTGSRPEPFPHPPGRQGAGANGARPPRKLATIPEDGVRQATTRPPETTA